MAQISTPDLLKDLLVYIHDGQTKNPDFKAILAECKKRLGKQ